MIVKNIDSICIWSEKPDKLAKWYEEKLGLILDEKVDIPDDYGYSYKLSGGKFIFFIGYHSKVKGKAKDKYRIMPGFDVDSVKKVYLSLKRKGVKFIKPASPSPDGAYYVATAIDLDGNILQFFSDKL